MAWGNRPTDLKAHIDRLLANDPQLTSLTLFSSLKIAPHALGNLFSALATNTYCRELHVSHHPVSSDALVKLNAALRVNTTLEYLCFGDNHLATRLDDWTLFCHALGVNRGLKTLDLANKGVRGQSLHVLTRQIKDNTVLERLVLDGNGIQDVDMRDWTPMGIRTLSLNDNNLETCEYIGVCLEGLGSLMMVGNPVRVDCAAALGKAVAASALTTVDVSGVHQLDDNTPMGDAFLQGLSTSEHGVKELKVGSRGVTDNGVRALVTAELLRHLDLSFNQLTNASAETLSSLPITELHLIKNRLDMEGFTTLLASPTLTKLNLCGNRVLFTSDQINTVSPLQYLDLSECGMQLHHVRACFDWLAQGSLPRLQHLFLGGNLDGECLESDEWHTMRDALRNSRNHLNVHV
jgi:Leucine-rich repeat (LRR) protein